MGTTERLVVDLPAELVDGLRDSVRAGDFASESEAVEAVLRVFYGSDGAEEPDIETLRAFVAERIAEADAGRFVDTDEMFARLRTRYLAKVAERTGG
jgi:Arc/MetJ-type ribon-helix-helix transcriptional regulator